MDDIPNFNGRGKKQSKQRRKLNGFYSLPYTDENDSRLCDMAIAEKSLRSYETDDHICMIVAEITAIQTWNKRLLGEPVSEALISVKAFWNWHNYKKIAKRRLELEGEHYKGIDARNFKPHRHYPEPEIGAMIREFVAKFLNPEEHKILSMWLEGVKDEEIAKELAKKSHAIEQKKTRIKQKIQEYLKEPTDEK